MGIIDIFGTDPRKGDAEGNTVVGLSNALNTQSTTQVSKETVRALDLAYSTDARDTPIPRSQLLAKAAQERLYDITMPSYTYQLLQFYSEVSTVVQAADPGLFLEQPVVDTEEQYPLIYSPLNTFSDFLLVAEIDPVKEDILRTFFLASIPETLSISTTPNMSLTRVRDGFVSNYAGFDYFMMTFSGKTRGFYHPFLGYTYMFKRTTRAYRNFMDFVVMAKSNGRVYTDTPKLNKSVYDQFGTSITPLKDLGDIGGNAKMKRANYISIVYGAFIFVGYIENFSYSAKAFNFDFNFTFNCLAIYRRGGGIYNV